MSSFLEAVPWRVSDPFPSDCLRKGIITPIQAADVQKECRQPDVFERSFHGDIGQSSEAGRPVRRLLSSCPPYGGWYLGISSKSGRLGLEVVQIPFHRRVPILPAPLRVLRCCAWDIL